MHLSFRLINIPILSMVVVYKIYLKLKLTKFVQSKTRITSSVQDEQCLIDDTRLNHIIQLQRTYQSQLQLFLPLDARIPFTSSTPINYYNT